MSAEYLRETARMMRKFPNPGDTTRPFFNALADWIDQAGADLWAHGIHCAVGCMECDDDPWAPHVRDALKVARAWRGDA